MNEVDFVILWVNGNDPAWQQEFLQTKQRANEDCSEIRYRDWNNLQYWFRGVEKFAPWVNKIHFITWGHLPSWLNTNHPKINIVYHSDFIPLEYLPTFNSNVIELNIHRIKNLAKQFVLFNDDTFLCRTCSVEDFFYKGLPRDFARLSIIQSSSIGHIIYNNLELINNLHIKNKVVKHHLSKWFSLQYGINSLIKTLTLMPWSTFPGFSDHHMPQPYLLSQFSRAWQIWPTELFKTCRNQFRDLTDLSHWLIRYDMLCRGEFRPKNFKDCKLLTINDASIDRICQDITNQHYRMVCLNDSTNISNFDSLSQQLSQAFQKILPEKTSFEL